MQGKTKSRFERERGREEEDARGRDGEIEGERESSEKKMRYKNRIKGQTINIEDRHLRLSQLAKVAWVKPTIDQ